MGLIKKLDIKESADFYRIALKLTEKAAERIINHLSLICNCSIEQGIFREKLKAAFTYSIQKGKPGFGCSNYRPISILSLLSKVYEKLIHTRLMDLTNTHYFTFKH